jgi:hypothetical protein
MEGGDQVLTTVAVGGAEQGSRRGGGVWCGEKSCGSAQEEKKVGLAQKEFKF